VRPLDAHTVNQIAAGEVVERPASVVKELVENAIDAGARRIEVELVDAGRTRIRVSDDGHGIAPEDVPIALQRHATSKIRAASDLETVATLGFRGEALPSIASVSRFRLESGIVAPDLRVLRRVCAPRAVYGAPVPDAGPDADLGAERGPMERLGTRARREAREVPPAPLVIERSGTGPDTFGPETSGPETSGPDTFGADTFGGDGLRVQVRVTGGEIGPAEMVSGPVGTTITVDDLFFNVPARRKFLRSDTTELGAALDHVTRYAMLHPEIAFTVRVARTEGGRLGSASLALQTPGLAAEARDLGGEARHSGGGAGVARHSARGGTDPEAAREALAALWGRDVARALARIEQRIGDVAVSGFVSPPHLTRSTRAYQHVFVNGRPVRNRNLTVAVDLALRDITPDRRFPYLVLMLAVPPHLVDVNVSPTKSEVRFRQESLAFDAIRRAIKQALLEHGMMPSAHQIAVANDALRQARDGSEDGGSRLRPVADIAASGSPWLTVANGSDGAASGGPLLPVADIAPGGAIGGQGQPLAATGSEQDGSPLRPVAAIAPGSAIGGHGQPLAATGSEDDGAPLRPVADGSDGAAVADSGFRLLTVADIAASGENFGFQRLMVADSTTGGHGQPLAATGSEDDGAPLRPVADIAPGGAIGGHGQPLAAIGSEQDGSPLRPVAAIATGGHGQPLAATGSAIEGHRLPPVANGSEDGGSRYATGKWPFAALLDGLRVIGQAMHTFIIAETRGGVVLIDQHVAHERILFERLCGLKGAVPVERQPLLVPQPLELDRRAAALLHDRFDELRGLGFELEPFGSDHTLLVRAAPAALRGKDPIRLLRDLIDEMTETTVQRRLVPTREQIWIMASCKMAVKAGDPLSIPEMERLVMDLAATENPYLCPHGRPITVTLGTADLLRLFKRT
jgi:DNA mismatch repair protein MutL